MQRLHPANSELIDRHNSFVPDATVTETTDPTALTEAFSPGSAGPFSRKTLQWRAFRALELTKPVEKRLELQPNPLELAPVAF